MHQVGDLFELNVKLRCQKVKLMSNMPSTETGLQVKWFARTKPLRAEISKSYFKIYFQHLNVNKKKLHLHYGNRSFNGTNKPTNTMRQTFGDSEVILVFRGLSTKIFLGKLHTNTIMA